LPFPTLYGIILFERIYKLEEFKYTLLKINNGYVGVVASKFGLRTLILPHSKKEETFSLLKEKLGDYRLLEDASFFNKLSEELIKYFKGEKVPFYDYPLDLSSFTPFQRDVWSVTQMVPYGEVRTYSWIAWKVGCSPRAVGGALRRNPLPLIIPCHRIISSNHGLGGFSFGIEWKRKLLEIEGHDSVGFAKNIWNKTGTRHKKTSAYSR
jgi:methylated-DNA-[protein]-cysteine S-methyltransferase